MILVNLRIGRIVDGYERICLLERTLPSQWRHRLLTAYTQRRKIYEQKINLPKKILMVGIAIAILLMVAGGILWWFAEDDLVAWIAFGIAALGLIGIWAILVYGAFALTQPKPPHPQHPYRNRLVQPMLPRWREIMRGRFPPADPEDYGAAAEQRFVNYLSDLDSSFILHRLKQRGNEDADVIVVGQKGIWVFEVKYWSGKITYRDAKWERDERTFRNEDGKLEKAQRHMSQPPDELWHRECGDIAITLKRRASALIARMPMLANIQGGIVFAHSNAKFDIDPSLSVAWNDPEGWKRQLANAPEIPGMDERASLEVLDALLWWYQELTNMSALVSMDRMAREMGQQAKEDLQKMGEPVNPLKSVILANGEFEKHPRLEKIWADADQRIAADGGAVNARNYLDLAPHIVIGDFDSMDDATRAWCEKARTEFIQHPREKNETDLELALTLARERGATQITVLGALGGRFDQMLSNVLLLVKPAQAGIPTRIAGIDFDAQVATKTTSIIGKIGETISLIPLTEHVDGIVTQGLRYPLRNESLYLGTARGVSNELIAEQAQVSFTFGIMLIVHLLDHPMK